MKKVKQGDMILVDRVKFRIDFLAATVINTWIESEHLQTESPNQTIILCRASKAGKKPGININKLHEIFYLIPISRIKTILER